MHAFHSYLVMWDSLLGRHYHINIPRGACEHLYAATLIPTRSATQNICIHNELTRYICAVHRRRAQWTASLCRGAASSPDGVGTHLVLPAPPIVQEAGRQAEALSGRVDSETAGVGGTGQGNIRGTGVCENR